ncbi:MAG: phosphate butyryltransferase [Candidatus Zixiibacteriota bacterium]|nr:MAG: phosphate butyryltransferase [candidate division Zixibacteria bacterium]
MKQTPIHSSDELIAHAIAIAAEGRKKTVAVAAAQDVDVIGAVSQAQADGFLDGILVGDESKIRSLADENKINITSLSIVNEPDVYKAAHVAVKLAADSKADAIMKGFLPTSALLKTVLDKQYGLRGENTLSHCAVLDIPGYHKLLNFTDGGMVVKPTPEQKYQVLDNAVLVGRALGLSPVKIALTVADTSELIPLATERLENIIIQGPLSLELASSPVAAKKAAVSGEVAGDADIFLVDSIEEGNIVAKSLIQFAQAVFAGVIVGARVPVSLVSRTDTVKNKKASLALACVIADYYTQNKVWGN